MYEEMISHQMQLLEKLTINLIFKVKFLMNLVIFGINMTPTKKVAFALTTLYGIGIVRAQEICASLGLTPQLKIKDLTENQQIAIVKKVKDDFIIEGNLEEQIKLDLNYHQTNGSLRGYRLRNGLPVRGQRTHSNSKTARKRLSVRKLAL
jgi:small subunit ribosomal protein S13